MWNDRKQDNSFPNKSAPLDSKVDFTPSRVGAIAPGTTIIGKAMVIKGRIQSKEDLHVDGEVDGSLELPYSRLTVGSSGKVGAGATAREVEVLGTVDGNVDATRKITIRRGGRLVGDLRTAGIVIEDGAYFKGKIEIVTSEPTAEPVAAAQPVAQPATSEV